MGDTHMIKAFQIAADPVEIREANEEKIHAGG
jgi:hypothetical protein